MPSLAVLSPRAPGGDSFLLSPEWDLYQVPYFGILYLALYFLWLCCYYLFQWIGQILSVFDRLVLASRYFFMGCLGSLLLEILEPLLPLLLL